MNNYATLLLLVFDLIFVLDGILIFKSAPMVSESQAMMELVVELNDELPFKEVTCKGRLGIGQDLDNGGQSVDLS